MTVGTGLDVTGQLVELDLSEVAAGGQLAGFMDAPTVGASHSGSAHHAAESAASASVAGVQKTALIQRSWSFPGTLAVAAGTLYYQLPVAETYVACTATVSTAPTGAAVRVDVNYHATAPASAVTIWTTNGNRPSIAASAFLNSAVTAPEVTAFAAGGVLSCDVDIIGSTIAGSNMVVTLYTKVA